MSAVAFTPVAEGGMPTKKRYLRDGTPTPQAPRTAEQQRAAKQKRKAQRRARKRGR